MDGYAGGEHTDPAPQLDSFSPVTLCCRQFARPPQASRQIRLLPWLSDDLQSFEEPAMLPRFLPLAAIAVYASVSLPAHAQAQQEAAGAVRGRIVDSVTGRVVPTATVNLMRNQGVHDTVETDASGEFSFDDVPEGVYSVEVEEQGYVKAVQADVRVVLRRVSAVEFSLVRGSEQELAEVVV